jgi:alkylhydroperoxidase family enzyme
VPEGQDEGLTMHTLTWQEVDFAGVVLAGLAAGHVMEMASLWAGRIPGLVAVATFRASNLFTPQERAALTMADAMTQTPVAVSDDLLDEARAQFTEPQLLELAATIARENYRARFNRAFAVESLGLHKMNPS